MGKYVKRHYRHTAQVCVECLKLAKSPSSMAHLIPEKQKMETHFAYMLSPQKSRKKYVNNYVIIMSLTSVLWADLYMDITLEEEACVKTEVTV